MKRNAIIGALIGVFMAWADGYNFNMRGKDAVGACLLTLIGAAIGTVVYALTEDKPNTPKE